MLISPTPRAFTFPMNVHTPPNSPFDPDLLRLPLRTRPTPRPPPSHPSHHSPSPRVMPVPAAPFLCQPLPHPDGVHAIDACLALDGACLLLPRKYPPSYRSCHQLERTDTTTTVARTPETEAPLKHVFRDVGPCAQSLFKLFFIFICCRDTCNNTCGGQGGVIGYITGDGPVCTAHTCKHLPASLVRAPFNAQKVPMFCNNSL
jgi:hypothetical protein